MDTQATLAMALYRLFRPVARIGLRHGVAVREVVEILKCAYVDVAREEYGLRGRPTSKARVATLTNLTRTEVARLVSRERTRFQQAGSRHPLHRLIERWLSDEQWQDQDGNPKILELESEGGFAGLVQAQGGDIPWQTLLRELERLAIAERRGDRVHLMQRGFVPTGGDETAGLPFIGEDAAALLDTLDYNLRANGGPRRFQRKVAFTGLSEAGLNALQARAAGEGQKFLERLDDELRPHAGSSDDQHGRLTGLGIYVFDLQRPEGEKP